MQTLSQHYLMKALSQPNQLHLPLYNTKCENFVYYYSLQFSPICKFSHFANVSSLQGHILSYICSLHGQQIYQIPRQKHLKQRNLIGLRHFCIQISAVVKGVEHISTNLKVNIEWRGFESRWFYQSGFEFTKLHY